MLMSRVTRTEDQSFGSSNAKLKSEKRLFVPPFDQYITPRALRLAGRSFA